MIKLDEALQIVLGSARPLGSERVELGSARKRVLGEDVASDMDMPPFDKALRDGYACRRADLGHMLTVIETIPAGVAPTREVGPDQCAKIMTGAALPRGADGVIMVEQTEPAGENVIRFTGEWTPDHISRRAEDIERGQIVLRKGCRIEPPQVAVLASVGCVRPRVAKRPRVGVLASGSEVVPPASRPGLSQIRNSNGPQLLAQLAAVGVKARDYGIVGDTATDVDRVLKAALSENDVVVISGGVSVGDFDLMPAGLRQNGVSLLFEKVAVKPGKPTLFGLREDTYCFGLPGNPVSTFVIFELIVKPFLYKLMGCDYAPLTVQMYLDEGIAREDTDRQSWIPVRRTSATTVRAVEYHGSAHISALCEADGLISMESGVTGIAQAAPVCVRLLARTGM
jgi:molybdopterin molybdotransferase